MRKVYYLPHCKTCQKALAEIGIDGESGFELQNTKEQHISGEELDQLKETVGSYEALFNRRAKKYRSEELKDKDISEAMYRELILGEYTFLKRPIIVMDGAIFVATNKKAVQAAKEKMSV